MFFEESKIKSKICKIGPSQAERILKNNKSNRSLRKNVVDNYCRDMKNDMWSLTHQGIAISDKNQLLDGQHRLHAIIKSGKTIELMVTTGIPEDDAMEYMVDCGAKRLSKDFLKVTKTHSASFRIIYYIATGRNNPTTYELSSIKAYLEKINLLEKIDAVFFNKKCGAKLKTSTLLTGYIISKCVFDSIYADFRITVLLDQDFTQFSKYDTAIYKFLQKRQTRTLSINAYDSISLARWLYKDEIEIKKIVRNEKDYNFTKEFFLKNIDIS